MEKRKNYTSESLSVRVQEGRDKWEPYVIEELRKQEVYINPANDQDDIINKIDGWLNKEPVQIKIRNTTVKERNDFSFELVQNFNALELISKQMNNPQTRGRDWKSPARHYFVLNRESSIIYHLDGTKIKKVIREAVEELEEKDIDLRYGSFVSKSSIEIKATKDRDINSHTPSKIMVFIPVLLVLLKEYETTTK
ncbi:MAG: hypothetical protein HEQ40_12070 [Lacibacter sp.]|jgi:hypothetical protein